MNTLDKKYQDLLQDILDNGAHKSDRTGTGTISVFGRQIRHNMKQGFPILTTKKVAWKGVVSELLWFLTGQTNISFLLKHNNHIWDGDAYKRYKTTYDIESREGTNGLEQLHMLSDLTKEQFIERIQTDKEFAKKWGDLGPIYGKQWRKWDSKNGRIDQIDNLINEIKTNPDSRRLMVSAWNVGELDQMVLPPCHYGFQVYTRELSKGERMDYWFKNHKPNRDVCDSVDESSEEEQHNYFDGANIPKRAISLMWNQRSVDTFLGLPFNIASYGLLLHIIANEVDMIPDELIGNLGDTHLYLNHIEQAKEQISRESFNLPTLKTNVKIDGICCATPDDFVLEGYQSQPTIKATLSN
jgi:thymidylate synthase